MSRAYVIAWKNPETGEDQYWSGDPDACGEFGFDEIGAAQLFPNEDQAVYAKESLDCDEEIQSTCRAVPVTVTIG